MASVGRWNWALLGEARSKIAVALWGSWMGAPRAAKSHSGVALDVWWKGGLGVAKSQIGVAPGAWWKGTLHGATKKQIWQMEMDGGNGAQGQSRDAWEERQIGGAGSGGYASTFGSGRAALLLGLGGFRVEGCHPSHRHHHHPP